ncbi:metallophosphoesterase [Chryseobacterium sp. StRB126]|uniref:hypothetical protein n=1 Tax=Chryseobacterium sp. StRB126 TaxID=878220 RepID=UPI0004E982A5|nr:hypothetical protein [Chryseobacterium sp. StRB126]BAP32471.1 metallophosphoesterase [Chryseobacterium sp. StRB126]
MKAQPVFPFLTEGSRMHRNKTVEYYHSSKKAFTALSVYDTNQKRAVEVGFLFYQVEELSQRLKTDLLYDELGLEHDNPMFECLYYIKHREGIQTFILSMGDNVAIIKARSVDLITEDVYAVG